MARHPGFDRPKVVQAALHLFWRDGYESTSIQKLLDAMGLNRGSLYNAFGDKAGLFHEVLDCYIDYQTEILQSNLIAKDDPVEAIRSFLEDFALHEKAEIRERGCLIFSAVSELSHTRPDLADEAWNKGNFLCELFVKRLKQAKARKLVREDKSVEELADYIVTLACGLRTHCKIKTDPTIIRGIIDMGIEALLQADDNDVCTKYVNKAVIN
ncbi:MAG: TetR/AcrR family transcriptional regulator [Porticoccaceae bacterium]|nr:TetR/AcrR family transcriptional regulator [Porticoccaceae bacterium]